MALLQHEQWLIELVRLQSRWIHKWSRSNDDRGESRNELFEEVVNHTVGNGLERKSRIWNPFGSNRAHEQAMEVDRTTGAQGIQFLRLAVSSRSALSAEVLFLRKQLAFYQEHQIPPRKLTGAARFSLVLWSRLFNWREALMIVKPETCGSSELKTPVSQGVLIPASRTLSRVWGWRAGERYP